MDGDGPGLYMREPCNVHANVIMTDQGRTAILSMAPLWLSKGEYSETGTPWRECCRPALTCEGTSGAWRASRWLTGSSSSLAAILHNTCHLDCLHRICRLS